MSGPLSKRQQVRNEKILQDLVQNVPGNNLCADCHARNPAWASWSLGVFLCMRCAAIHRKLGTHISKVKSLSMDSWSNEQVDNMRKVGNATSNKIYNPQNKKPPVPIDVDEADSAMERFIRQKYMNNSVSSARRHDTGSTESDETPPPLPPKTPSRFGFRSATSIFPLSSRAKKEASASGPSRRPPPSPQGSLDHTSPGSPRNKASRVFGASVSHESQDETDRKLAKIRDMGFHDEQRNAMVLRGMNGNLEKTVEALIRLGEGDGRSPTFAVPRETATSLKRSLTPASSLSVPQPRSPSTNPFDALDMPPAQPQSSQSTGTLQTKNPYNTTTTNPFGPPTQQGLSLEQAFQGMSLAPSQPLFPHHTGGLPAASIQGQPQPQLPPQLPGHAQFAQSPSQPVHQQASMPGTAHQNMAPFAFNNSQTYPPPLPVQQSMQTGYNPFFANPVQQQPAQQPAQQMSLSVNTSTSDPAGLYMNNPFTRSPTRIQSPSTLTQIPEQTQQNFYSSPVSMSAMQQQPWAAPTTGPFQGYSISPASAALQPPQNNPFFVPQVTQPQMAAAQVPKADKASIMALYNYPQLAPNPFLPQPDQTSVATSLNNAPAPRPLQQQQQQQQQQHQAFVPQPPARAMTSPPTAGNNNPFFGVSGGSGLPKSGLATGGRSRDSVLALGMEWSNGRHSPDAFTSLSARDLR